VQPQSASKYQNERGNYVKTKRTQQEENEPPNFIMMMLRKMNKVSDLQ